MGRADLRGREGTHGLRSRLGGNIDVLPQEPKFFPFPRDFGIPLPRLEERVARVFGDA